MNILLIDRKSITDSETDQNGMIDYAWHRAVISDGLYEEIKKNCNFKLQIVSNECNSPFQKYIEVYNIIDIYSLYTPTRVDNNYTTISESYTHLKDDAQKYISHNVSVSIHFATPSVLRYLSHFFFALVLKK